MSTNSQPVSSITQVSALPEAVASEAVLTKPHTRNAIAIAAVTPKTTRSRPPVDSARLLDGLVERRVRDRVAGRASTASMTCWVGRCCSCGHQIRLPRDRRSRNRASSHGRPTHPRELRSERPRTMPMKRLHPRVLVVDQPGQPDLGGRQVGDRAVGRCPCAGAAGRSTSARSTTPVPEATTSTASLTDISGQSSCSARRRPARARAGAPAARRRGRRGVTSSTTVSSVLGADHGDRQLVVQRDAVQPVAVDRQPDQAHVERRRCAARPPARPRSTGTSSSGSRA